MYSMNESLYSQKGNLACGSIYSIRKKFNWHKAANELKLNIFRKQKEQHPIPSDGCRYSSVLEIKYSERTRFNEHSGCWQKFAYLFPCHAKWTLICGNIWIKNRWEKANENPFCILCDEFSVKRPDSQAEVFRLILI